MPRAELVGDQRKLVHLRGGHGSARDLGANHVHAGLALAVHAAPQALGAELVVGQSAGHVLFGVRTEELNVRPNGSIVLRFGVGLDVRGLGGQFSDHDYPYVYRDYYISRSFTIR